ncbi:unnamed protein product [Closterium sp. NIES-53]
MAPYTKPLEPSIAAQVAVLCSFPKFGFQVRDVRCGWEDAEFADRFTVHVPCGWDKLEWYVQFNGSRPWDPPDVIFHSSPDGLCFQPLLLPDGMAGEGSSWGLLKDWQHNDSYRLLRLLLHLRALFLQQQRQQAEAVEDGRVKFELSTLAQQVRGGGGGLGVKGGRERGRGKGEAERWHMLQGWEAVEDGRVQLELSTLAQQVGGGTGQAGGGRRGGGGWGGDGGAGRGKGEAADGTGYRAGRRWRMGGSNSSSARWHSSRLHPHPYSLTHVLPFLQSTPEELQLAVPVLGIDLRPLTHFSSSSPSLTVQVPPLFLPHPPHSQFKFPLTHSSSPPSLSPASPQQIKFPISGTSGSANGKASTPQLKLGGPPLLLSLLGFPETKLPAWTDTMCTVAYLPELAAFIHQRLDTAVSSMQSRAEFISALPAVFGQPLETDTQLFSHTTLFVSANSCMCLHFTAHNHPVASEPISSFPWSPRWSPAQMAQRLGSFLEDETVAFKRFCIDVSRAAASART